MAKKDVTINDLAVMVKHRFDAVDARFEAVDKRFDGIEQRLVNIESDVSYLKSRVGEIARTLDEHAEILEEHSAELKWVHEKIDELTPRCRYCPCSAARHVWDSVPRVACLQHRTTPAAGQPRWSGKSPRK